MRSIASASPRTRLAHEVAGEAVVRYLKRQSQSTPPVYALAGRNVRRRRADGWRAVNMTPNDDWFVNSRRTRPTV